MARVKRGVNKKRKHKKVLKLAKGYIGSQSKQYRPANEAVMKALRFSYIGRRQKKRDYRSLWITRINAASRMHNLSYSRFMNGLKKADVQIDRKILAELAVNDPDGFKGLVDLAKSKLA